MMSGTEFVLRVAGGWFIGSVFYSLSKEIVRAMRQGYRIAAVYTYLAMRKKKPTLREWFHHSQKDFMQYYASKGIGPYWIPHDGKSRITARR